METLLLYLLRVLLPSSLVLRVRHVPEVIDVRRAAHVLVQGGVQQVLVWHGSGAVQVVRVPPQGPLPAAIAVVAAAAARVGGACCVWTRDATVKKHKRVGYVQR